MSSKLIVFVFVGWIIKIIPWSLDFISASTRLSAVWRVLPQTLHDEGQHPTPASHEETSTSRASSEQPHVENRFHRTWTSQTKATVPSSSHYYTCSSNLSLSRSLNTESYVWSANQKTAALMNVTFYFKDQICLCPLACLPVCASVCVCVSPCVFSSVFLHGLSFTDRAIRLLLSWSQV